MTAVHNIRGADVCAVITCHRRGTLAAARRALAVTLLDNSFSSYCTLIVHQRDSSTPTRTSFLSIQIHRLSSLSGPCQLVEDL